MGNPLLSYGYAIWDQTVLPATYLPPGEWQPSSQNYDRVMER